MPYSLIQGATPHNAYALFAFYLTLMPSIPLKEEAGSQLEEKAVDGHARIMTFVKY